MSSRNDASATDIESAIGQDDTSPSNSLRNLAMREKHDNKDREDISIEAEQQPSDTLTACLQVVGAFFLMMNSWYVRRTTWRSITNFLQGNRKHIRCLPNVLPAKPP